MSTQELVKTLQMYLYLSTEALCVKKRCNFECAQFFNRNQQWLTLPKRKSMKQPMKFFFIGDGIITNMYVSKNDTCMITMAKIGAVTVETLGRIPQLDNNK